MPPVRPATAGLGPRRTDRALAAQPLTSERSAQLEIAHRGLPRSERSGRWFTRVRAHGLHRVDSGEFTRRVAERTGQLRQGVSGEFDVGAIFWPRQLEIIEEHVADAVAKGAKVLCGGRRNPSLEGLFYEPTVLVEVRHDMRIMSEETFGPVLPIMRVNDEEAAIRMANDSGYGLGANVWTRDRSKGLAMARRVESGSVCVNDMTMTYGVQEAPFGGVKHSGVGQVNGETGLKGYCHATPILVDRFGGKQTAARYPYTREKDEQIRKVMHLQWGTALGRWLG